VISVISRVSIQLPLTIFKLSNEYFRILVTPQFVFVLGNIIVIILFMNHGRFYQNNMKSPKISTYNTSNNIKSKHVSQGKGEENTIMATIFSTPEHQVIKIYHRSKSENIGREKIDSNCSNLRRSNTETKRVTKSSNKTSKGDYYPEDHMSNDEFRRTIEDFIAKQQRFLREEEDDFTGF